MRSGSYDFGGGLTSFLCGAKIAVRYASFLTTTSISRRPVPAAASYRSQDRQLIISMHKTKKQRINKHTMCFVHRTEFDKEISRLSKKRRFVMPH